MKRILITGANGQLGKELTEKASENFTVMPLRKEDLDITDYELVTETMKQLKPDIILHTAAYTAVDQCEIEKMAAYEINALGSSYIAEAANVVGAKLIYFSTDFVFDGKKTSPYQVEDEPNPLSSYGLSKWLGERLVLTKAENCSIIRTSWLYGHHGQNFVKTMLRLAKKGEPINVVADQIGSPTYTADLADYVLKLIDKPNHLYHISNSGACSWFDFARKIFEKAGYDSTLVRPTTTERFGALAIRPSYSVMSHQQLIRVGLELPRKWELALDDYFIKGENQQ
ncbi:dTDP-4-dehydrorhamnose reductase [Halalkalibacter urbisdiaboli]|uniref:dTDP-4-dehydrorhamnose reductase n=1 Tax=Halalkalibacter urbisdiaboli TaxID=1960589 RepID=UPI000B45503A|nr:dTDP-4-dehydrorhamnose reductase [Halalkalibacter urbisdiaboli]